MYKIILNTYLYCFKQGTLYHKHSRIYKKSACNK
nr:MAG TPA: hypothetical protein [Caudoviricetes sp.]